MLLTMQVKRLTDAAGDELNDLEIGYEHTRWPLINLFEYTTEALEQIAVVKPELFVEIKVVQLRLGAEQIIPDSFGKLLDIPVNINSDGTRGSDILEASFLLMRGFNKPICQNGGAKVGSYMVNPRNPRGFIVSPPAASYPPQYVQLMGQGRVKAVTATTERLYMPGGAVEDYFNCLLDWVLYRAFMKDTESQSSLQRANIHYKAFFTGLGVRQPKTQTQPVTQNE